MVGRLARGGNIPLGYYNDPEKTAETFVTDAQGRRWSIPGDYALLEADGRITLLGRGSVSINSGGEKIYPEEVEGALKSHPDVFDVLVVGVPDERWGERVAALLQPRAGRDADARRAAGALPRRGSRATRSRASCCSSTRCRACRTGSPTTGPPRSRRTSARRDRASERARRCVYGESVPVRAQARGPGDRSVMLAMTPRRLHRIAALAAFSFVVAPLARVGRDRDAPAAAATSRRTRR